MQSVCQFNHVGARRLVRPLAAIALCSLSAMQAPAALETFDYPDGVLDGQGSVGEWTGPWQPGPASLTGTPPSVLPFRVESNQLKIDLTNQTAYGYQDWDVQRSLTSPLATSSVYMSFEITPGEMGSRVGVLDDAYAWLNIGFSDQASNMASKGAMFSVYKYNSSGTEFVRIGSSLDGIYDGTTFTVTNWTPGQSYKLVGRLDFDAFGTEQWTVWLNPTDESSIPQVVTSKELGYTSIGFTQMWYAIYNLNNTQDTYVDNLRIGSTWESAVLPEPSSLALLGMGGMAFARRRR